MPSLVKYSKTSKKATEVAKQVATTSNNCNEDRTVET